MEPAYSTHIREIPYEDCGMSAIRHRVAIAYATTSGSTRTIAEVIRDRLSGYDPSLANIAQGIGDEIFDADVLFLGTPTYGTGDCHYLWHENKLALAQIKPETTVAIFCLADARIHQNSFAGGLAVLRSMLPHHVTTLGSVPSEPYSYVFSPSENAGFFPGFVVEYRRNRQLAVKKAGDWAESVVFQSTILPESGSEAEPACTGG
jgi:flavodoxin I